MEHRVKWRRTPYGYLSVDGRWFLERGARMTHGCNAWLIWRLVEDESMLEFNTVGTPYDPATGDYAREFTRVTGLDEGEGWFVDMHLEGGWLSEAKEVVEKLIEEEAQS